MYLSEVSNLQVVKVRDQMLFHRNFKKAKERLKSIISISKIYFYLPLGILNFIRLRMMMNVLNLLTTKIAKHIEF